MRWLVSLLIVYVSVASAQTFRAEASLPEIKVKGFYRILVDPGIAVHARSDFANLRIIDEKNVEVPYLLKVDEFNPATVGYSHVPSLTFKVADSAKQKQTILSIKFDTAR